MGTYSTPGQTRRQTIDELTADYTASSGVRVQVLAHAYDAPENVLWVAYERADVTTAELEARPFTGYDYGAQAWVKDGKYEPCGHPARMTTPERPCCHVPAIVGLSSAKHYELGPKRWLICHKLTPAGNGYKPMGVEEHPYFYSCPLALLDLVPQTDSHHEREWRLRVRTQPPRNRAATVVDHRDGMVTR